MSWNAETLNVVYAKTGGYCRYCEKKIARVNYGNPWGRGAWEIDHSMPLSRGGTDHRNNLYPACVACNREKGSMTGPEFLRFFEDAPAEKRPWWEGLVEVLLGAVAVGLVINALSNASRSR